MRGQARDIWNRHADDSVGFEFGVLIKVRLKISGRDDANVPVGMTCTVAQDSRDAIVAACVRAALPKYEDCFRR